MIAKLFVLEKNEIYF